MERIGEDRMERCVDCGAELDSGQDRAFAFGTTGVLCASCAVRRGGRYDVERDAWSVAPDYRDLESEFR
jgi:hypothetical protein